MPGKVRVGDICTGLSFLHNDDCCPHSLVGMFIKGSYDHFTNKRPTMRSLFDFLVHSCPHCNIGITLMGSPDARINSDFTLRTGDVCFTFCGIIMPASSSFDSDGNSFTPRLQQKIPKTELKAGDCDKPYDEPYSSRFR